MFKDEYLFLLKSDKAYHDRIQLLNRNMNQIWTTDVKSQFHCFDKRNKFKIWLLWDCSNYVLLSWWDLWDSGPTPVNKHLTQGYVI